VLATRCAPRYRIRGDGHPRSSDDPRRAKPPIGDARGGRRQRFLVTFLR
jgi:hypothetical protein